MRHSLPHHLKGVARIEKKTKVSKTFVPASTVFFRKMKKRVFLASWGVLGLENPRKRKNAPPHAFTNKAWLGATNRKKKIKH